MQTGERLYRVLVAHNSYQYRGGEDSVCEEEVRLLRSRGHEVAVYSRHNAELGTEPTFTHAIDTIWSRRTASDIEITIQDFKPDIIHAHNIFPLISPSLYWVARKHKVPIVQTLHNYRLLCAQGSLNRLGASCEKCIGTLPWRSIVHGCYRESRSQSGLLTAMLGIHRSLGTYRNQVTRYIALDPFCRDIFVRGGIPADKISIKGNFVDLPRPTTQSRHGFLYVGRLSSEKGAAVLHEAWQDELMPPLTVIGDGPMREIFSPTDRITALGRRSSKFIYDLMNRSIALVLPSIVYENFPRVLVEAYACGLPVIASKYGPLKNLIEDRNTGLLFEPGNAGELNRIIHWADNNRENMAAMGSNCRYRYEEYYNADANYHQLIDIYSKSIQEIHEVTACLT